MAAILIVEDNAELAHLVSSVGELRGHLTRVALSGTEALIAAGQQRFEAAIVDLFLPDLDGTAVLERLKAAHIALFVMSGVYRGSAKAAELKERFGVVAFFEKPFPILELLKKIEEVTGPAQARASHHSEAGYDPFGETVLVADPAGDEAAQDLAAIETFERAAPGDPPAPGAASPAAAASPARPTMPRSGSLVRTSVPHLLNAAFQARLNGDLVVKHGASQAMKVMSFEAGQPVYAASNLAHERFARFCARKGLLPPGDLEAVAQLAKEQRLKTGEAMVRLGLLDDQKRRALLEEQIKEIIWSTFSWTSGEYAFAPDRPLKADVVKIAVFPGQLILDGCLREPLVALRERMKLSMKLFPAAAPPYGLEQLTLTGDQAQVIAWTDGTKTVADLVALSDLDERDVLGLLYGLTQAGLVEQRSDGGRGRRVSYGL